MTEALKIGLIGCGNMMEAHATAVNQVDGIEIAAVCDIIRGHAEKVAEALGNDPLIFTDFEDVTDHVDAVLIALPHDLHYECGMYFASKKKHILMEKPLCNSEEECLSLIKACEESNVTLMCGYPVRYHPGIIELKRMVDSGEYGRVIQMSVWTEQHTRPGNPNGRPHWANTSRLGGGQFFSHGCHYIDLLMWFLGAPEKGMKFGTRVGSEYMIGEGTSASMMYFKNGAIGYHGATWVAKGSRLGTCFQIMTEKGLLEYDSGQIRVYDSLISYTPGQPYNIKKSRTVWRPQSKTRKSQYEIAHFADCIKNGKRPLTDGWSSLQSLRAIWRMCDAEKRNIVADLSDLPDLSKDKL